ncbi:MAG: DUF5106 domain-containing protein [Bacteroides sp.]|nr:DUF5106 domain-containing protein [Bacteroides sp.]
MRCETLMMCLLTFLLLSCSGGQQAQTVNKKKKVLAFQLPEVPVMLQQAEERLNYVVQHYWDNFDFKDTAYIHVPDVTEQALVNYIDLLTRVPMEMADTCLTRTIRRSMQETKMEEYMTGLFHRYLMDPNSPLRCEELYEPVARLMSNHPDLVKSSKAQHDLRLINLNRRGTLANDFVYTLYGGTQHRMHQLKADYTILFFYNPDCETCAEVLKQMKQSVSLNDWLAGKHVKLLAVYPEEEYKLWEAYRSQLPETWINSYDKEHKLLYDGLYDLKAMPSLYLLDRDKKVLLKDAFWGQIQEYLKNNSL